MSAGPPVLLRRSLKKPFAFREEAVRQLERPLRSAPPFLKPSRRGGWAIAGVLLLALAGALALVV